ncbi:hypothetical protein Msi02_14190 [Microbispora siamensis]|uniref:Uncharacterized protein n=1 Tax=Microbispora siamensis TaxID=564413 RepID=A0ABQ4GGR1_9ACTN|nr:hypothetical protein Msi02_14190 [Microbispora siamensis]
MNTNSDSTQVWTTLPHPRTRRGDAEREARQADGRADSEGVPHDRRPGLRRQAGLHWCRGHPPEGNEVCRNVPYGGKSAEFSPPTRTARRSA